jgi:adenine-specific DNA-methyltransferase
MDQRHPRKRRASPDVVAENIARLRDLWPEAFADGKIDFDVLREILGDYVDNRQERYSFSWPGKSRARRIAQLPSTGTLLPCLERSVNWDRTENLFIEGDNLEVLKLLRKSYHRKVKLIYIDPPYNTGNEFIYPDRYQDNLETYLRYTGQLDHTGPRISPSTETAGRYHSNWLSMMYPRLLLARGFLQEDGFIVASIDDHELANLVAVMDETMGVENRVATLVWDKARKNDAKLFSVGHDYMLVYARNREYLRQQKVTLRTPKEGVEQVRAEWERLRSIHADDWDQVRIGLREYFRALPAGDPKAPLGRYTKVDERGPYRDDKDIGWPGGGGPTYEVLHPKTKQPCKQPRGGWRFPTPERFWEEAAKGRVTFGPDHETVPSIRSDLFQNATQVMTSVHYSYSQTISDEFDAIFGGVRVFDNAKHYKDLARLIDYLTASDSIVLDFFAGSATTGHAVIEANRTCASKRRYICVQLPEPVGDTTTVGRNALSLGLKTISDVALERLRRVDDGSGFRVYRLAARNLESL